MGSFVAAYEPARLSSDRTRLLPPCKKVVFNSQEIWNDERLERELARYTGCSLAESSEQIAFWVDDICFRLATSKVVWLEQIGMLTITDDNKIQFELDANVNFSKNAFGLEAIKVKYVDIPSEAQVGALVQRTSKKSYGLFIFIGLLLVAAGILIYLYYR